MPLRKCVAIYLGNHRRPRKDATGFGVTDHVQWLKASLDPHVDVIIANDLISGIHNIVLEYFNIADVMEIEKFHSMGNRYSVVLTENFNNTGRNLVLNSVRWSDKNEYMPKAYPRFLNMLKVLCNATTLLTVGGIPSVEAIRSYAPNHPLVMFDEPPLEGNVAFVQEEIVYDLSFFGKITAYRRAVLDEIEKAGIRVETAFDLPQQERDRMIARARYNLHIPQYPHWNEMSPMRVYAAARLGRPTCVIGDVSQPPRTMPDWCMNWVHFLSFDDLTTLSDTNFRPPVAPPSSETGARIFTLLA